MTDIVLETERLYLRHLTPGDAGFIQRLLNDPSYIRNIGDKKVRTTHDARDYIRNGPMASYEKNGFGLFCVELKTTRTPIGTCGLLKRDFLEFPDLGYAFLSGFQSKGYGYEAAQGVMAYSKKTLNIVKTAAIVNSDNPGSIRLLEKLGFAYKEIVMFPDTKKSVRLFMSG